MRAVGGVTFTLLFAGHMYLPHLALASPGPRWYLNSATLFFVLLAAVLGSVAAGLVQSRQFRRRWPG